MKRLIRHLIVLALATLAVSPGLGRDLSEIRQDGRLNAASRPTSTLMFSPGNEDLPGFCYELASAFAQSIDLEIEMAPVSSFRDYWEPVKPDGSPALLTEVDMYADILTATPQRRETVAMVPFIESTEILVGASPTTANSLEDLRGRRIAVVEGMSFQRVLENALSAAEIPFQREPARVHGDVIVPISGTEAANANSARILLLPPGTRTALMFFPDQLAKAAIDFFILDSLSLFHQLNMSQSLRTSVRPVFPLGSEVGHLSFATSRHAPELTAALAGWMKQYRASEAYHDLVERYIGIRHEEYLAFVRDFPR